MNKKLKLQVGNLTDVGLVRKQNEDYYGKYEGHFGSLFLVCDGMGGHARGDIASRLAVETIRQYFQGITYPLAIPMAQVIATSIGKAQQAIMDHVSQNPDNSGMGTTIVLLLIQDDQYWYAHVGDSRIYLKQGHSISQLTKDHSRVQEMVDSGILSAEQAREHPNKNVISRALGSEHHQPDVSGPHALSSGDTFLMCSDGLSGYFRDDELLIELTNDPQLACQNLVNIAKQRGGEDNITIQVIRAYGSGEGIPKAAPEHPKSTAKASKLPVYIMAVMLVIQLALIAYLWQPWHKNNPDATANALIGQEIIEGEMDALFVLAPNPAKEQEYGAFVNQLLPDSLHLQVKFIAKRGDGMAGFVLPRRAIYLAYQDLTSARISNDEIRYILLHALAMSQSNPDTLQWRDIFAATAGIPRDIKGDELGFTELKDRFGAPDPAVKANLETSAKTMRDVLYTHGLDIVLAGTPAKTERGTSSQNPGTQRTPAANPPGARPGR